MWKFVTLLASIYTLAEKRTKDIFAWIISIVSLSGKGFFDGLC